MTGFDYIGVMLGVLVALATIQIGVLVSILVVLGDIKAVLASMGTQLNSIYDVVVKKN